MIIIENKLVKIEKNNLVFYPLVEPYLAIDTSYFSKTTTIVLKYTSEDSKPIKNIIKVDLKNEKNQLQNLPFSGDIFLYTNNTVFRTIDLSKTTGNLYDLSIESISDPAKKFEVNLKDFEETKIQAKNIINMTSTKLIELDSDKG